MNKKQVLFAADGTDALPEASTLTAQPADEAVVAEATRQAVMLGRLIGSERPMQKRLGLTIQDRFVSAEVMLLFALLIVGIVIACRINQ